MKPLPKIILLRLCDEGARPIRQWSTGSESLDAGPIQAKQRSETKTVGPRPHIAGYRRKSSVPGGGLAAGRLDTGDAGAELLAAGSVAVAAGLFDGDAA
jgi:hypothetical protein